MKEWKEYLFKVNGFEMTAVYNEDTIQKVLLPLLKQLQQLQKEKKERIIVFMAAPPAVGKTTLCEFFEYLSKQVLQRLKNGESNISDLEYKINNLIRSSLGI